MDFFENTVNPQRTCGIIVEQMMTKQYIVKYGNNQYTKVNTVNMVLANSAILEVDPEDDDLNIDEIEEDTGLTQQPRGLCPALPSRGTRYTYRAP